MVMWNVVFNALHYYIRMWTESSLFTFVYIIKSVNCHYHLLLRTCPTCFLFFFSTCRLPRHHLDCTPHLQTIFFFLLFSASGKIFPLLEIAIGFIWNCIRISFFPFAFFWCSSRKSRYADFMLQFLVFFLPK